MHYFTSGNLSTAACKALSRKCFGVTQFTLSNYWKRQATIAEVKALTKAEASEIYKYEYFKRPRFDELPNQLQPVMFDMGINHGPKRAVKLLQSVCVKSGYKIVVDGRIGFKTLSAGRSALKKMQGWFINALVEERLVFYRYLIRKNPTLKKYKFGWTRRAKEFLVSGSDDYIAANIADRLMGVAA